MSPENRGQSRALYEVSIAPRKVSDVVPYSDAPTDSLKTFLNNPQEHAKNIIAAAGRNVWVPSEVVGIEPDHIYTHVEFSGGFWRPFESGKVAGIADMGARIIKSPSNVNFAQTHRDIVGAHFYQNGRLKTERAQYQPTGGYTLEGMQAKVLNTLGLFQASQSGNQTPFILPIPLMSFSYAKGAYGMAWLTQSPQDRSDQRMLKYFTDPSQLQESIVSEAAGVGLLLRLLHGLRYTHGQFTLGNVGRTAVTEGKTALCLYDLSTLRPFSNNNQDDHLNRAYDLRMAMYSASILFDRMGDPSLRPFWFYPLLQSYTNKSIAQGDEKIQKFVQNFHRANTENVVTLLSYIYS